MKIAIVDDLKLDAEQLSHLIFSYMKEHRIPTAARKYFQMVKHFSPALPSVPSILSS